MIRSIAPILRLMGRKQLRPRVGLPHIESIEHHAWAEGWWMGIGVGLVTGIAIGLVLLKV